MYSGYPYLVSRLCRLIDEKGKTGDVWNREGFLEAVRTMMGENNALFESLIGKLSDYPELERMLKDLLFSGKPITYNPTNQMIGMAEMFGFVKNAFICDGHLDMKRVLEKFVRHFHELYGDRKEEFLEEEGRRYFLLYLRPIINGTGNYYVESRTRSFGRTDIIVDYRGEQFIVETKIWKCKKRES